MHRSSYCGINCEKCKAYIATLADNDELKEQLANEWGELYKRHFSKEDMICYGCKSDTLFVLCSLCDIRTCNEKHEITNCEDCASFICERMNRFFEYHKTHDTGGVFD